MFNLKKNKRYKILYKKLLILRTNLNNDIKIFKFKKKKWKIFLTILKIKKRLKIRLKPFTNNYYIATKFASHGNSFQNKFKYDLIAKKTFNYSYGNLMKKYLKKRMSILYNSKEFYNYKLTCLKFFESRLDSVLYRSKFCYSIKNAKHLISHKHIMINNKIEKNRAYILNPGDLIKIKHHTFRLIKRNLKRIIYMQMGTKKIISSYKKKFRYERKRMKKINFDLLWPIPPKYLIINYKTLEIIFDNIKNPSFCIYFPIRLNFYSIITNYYRH